MFAEAARLPVGLSRYTILGGKVTQDAHDLILVEGHVTCNFLEGRHSTGCQPSWKGQGMRCNEL